jgi:Domain of unknown function DUF29
MKGKVIAGFAYQIQVDGLLAGQRGNLEAIVNSSPSHSSTLENFAWIKTCNQFHMSTLAEIYEQDFYAWLIRNAELLHQGRLSEIDIEHIAEELEGMSRSERRELMSRLAMLLAHLLKWIYQPYKRSRSWRATIEGQREDLRALLAESPSLKPELEQKLNDAYRRAKIEAEKQTRISEDRFPEACPFTLGEVLDNEFWPD